MRITQGAQAHNQLTGIGAGDHHAQLHQAAHRSGGADPLADATLPVTQASADAAAAGAAGTLANITHRHGMPAIPAQATQAALEAETVETTYSSPDRVKFSPGVAKAWCHITSTGLLSTPDYNVLSVTDTGLGDRTVVWDVDFSGIIYAPIATLEDTTGRANAQFNALAVGSARHTTWGAVGTLTDVASGVVAFGDQ